MNENNYMPELIHISYDGNYKPTVSGRELHQALEVQTQYSIWFKRMCEYGFSENVDFTLVIQKRLTNNPKNPYTEITDHQLTIDMAKEICMIQRSEIGKKCRQYFIEIERQWNSPEAVMARALKVADVKLLEARQHIQALETTVAVQNQKIQELQPKASYYDVILNCTDAISTSVIAKDYGKSAIWMNNYLHEKGVQYKHGDVWLLYQKYADKGYTCTKTHTVNGKDGKQHIKVHTYWTQKGRIFIYELLKSDGILPTIERKDKAVKQNVEKD